MSHAGQTFQENGGQPPSFPWRRYATIFLAIHGIALLALVPAFLSMVLFGGGAGLYPVLVVAALCGGACTLVLIVNRVLYAFRHAGANTPSDTFPWRFYALAFVLIYVMMISPAIVVGLTQGVAGLIGCTVDFISAGPCKAFGHDWGGLLSKMELMGWYIIDTIIFGVVLSNLLCIGALIHLAYRSRHSGTATKKPTTSGSWNRR